jgi:hypothetical protein
MLFSKIFSEDKDLWWNLCLEEKNHAALLRSGMEYFMPAGAFPLKILYPKAFLPAIKLEKSSGELHFQQIMKESTDSKIMKVFQRLNKKDRSHLQRIRAFMREKGGDKVVSEPPSPASCFLAS